MELDKKSDFVTGNEVCTEHMPPPGRDTPASGSDVLTLSIGRSTHIMQLMRSTLTFVEDSLLAHQFSGRWDHNLARDAQGNFFLEEDPVIMVPLLHYLRDMSRSTPLASTFEPPQFQDHYTEKRFRLVVDHYGLTDAFYPVALFKHHAPSTIVSRNVLQWDMGEPQADDNKHYYIDLLRRPLDSNSLRHQPLPFERKFKSFEVTIRNPTVGHALIGWMQRGSIGRTSLVYFLTTCVVPVPPGPAISHHDTFQREYLPVPNLAWTANQAICVNCRKLENGHLEWSVQGRVIAKTVRVGTDPEPDMVHVEWVPPSFEEPEMIPYIAIYQGCHLRISAMELEF